MSASIRAAPGAAYLDGVRLGWHAEINLSALDLASCVECILGQLYGDYVDATHQLDLSPADARGRGFERDRAAGVDYFDLVEAWAREITHRRLCDVGACGPAAMRQFMREHPLTRADAEVVDLEARMLDTDRP